MFTYVETDQTPYHYNCGIIEIKTSSLQALREEVLRVFSVDILTFLN